MISIKDTDIYNSVLKENKYPYGRLFMFKGFVVAEFNEGEVITWDNHVKVMANDISDFYETDGADIIYISNRVNSYSIVATDWLKFFQTRFTIKMHCIVSNNRVGSMNSMIEKLFFSRIKHFNTLSEAVAFATSGSVEVNN